MRMARMKSKSRRKILRTQSLSSILGEFNLAKNKGKKFECEECGAVVVYDSDCSCDVCDVVCCGVPMKPKK